ncbi:MAG: hypothetical protein JOZ03_12555 [Gammaproteobacteria bacterium]|nr:hypothetical protein [Gammaproteobacteria bacterium]
MEAASRPSLEALSDLPLEAPVEAAVPAKPPAAPSAAAIDPGQTGTQFLDPAALMLEGAMAESPAPAPADPPAAREPELVLEDPAVVEELLTRPAPPASAAPSSAQVKMPSAAPATPGAPVSREIARVPIARTASLSSKPVSGTPAARPAGRAAPAPAPRPAPVARPSAKPASPSAQGLADWTSARAAVAAAVTPPPAVAPVLKNVPKPEPAPSSAPAGAPMDRDFIARNQVVERYLSGRLPLKGATEFEQFCHHHPELLDEIGLPERVNAGLRLLEASGKPEPWQEAPKPAWQKPQVTLALAGAVALLTLTLLILAGANAAKAHHIAELQKQVADRPLDPATSTREIRLLPSRSGASTAPAISIGGAAAQLADFKIDESRSPYHIFRITIDRLDQGRVGVLNNLVKDSNGHLRLALNSSALGPGNYQLTIEGLNWRGDPEPDSWVTIGVVR